MTIQKAKFAAKGAVRRPAVWTSVTMSLVVLARALWPALTEEHAQAIMVLLAAVGSEVGLRMDASTAALSERPKRA